MSYLADGVPLSVGVVLDRARQERWVLGALQRVVALSDVRLVAVAIANGATRASSPAGALHVAVDSVDRALRCRREPRFARVDVVAELAPPRSIVVSALRSADGWTVTTGDAAFLAGCGVDVWLCFTALRPCRPFPRVSRFGVWGIEIGVDTPAVDRWAGASEVAAAHPLTETALVDYRESTRTAISRTIGATIGNSARSNRLSSLCKALPICARAVRALSRSGAAASAAPAPATNRPGRPTPTSGAVLSLAGRIVGAVAANRWRALRWRDQWQIGYCFPDRDDRRLLATERLRYLVPPPDRFWADPFALEHDGRYFIFFEELVFRTGLGRITAVEVFEHAEPSAPQVVLERPYHLSYPSIFAWRDTLYMLPETGALGKLQLYRCEEPPARWSPDAVLLEGVNAYDATLWSDGQRCWLFASVAEPGADPSDELSLFFSETPFGPWQPHPANPIVADVRCARSAGPVFTEAGVAYRPSQDCSESYGRAVGINRIDVITTEDYRETPVARITADGGLDARCVHTYGGGKLQVVDCLVRGSKWTVGRLPYGIGASARKAPPALAGGAEYRGGRGGALRAARVTDQCAAYGGLLPPADGNPSQTSRSSTH